MCAEKYDAVLQWIGERTGLAFRHHQRERAAAAVARCLSRAGVSGPETYLTLLERDAAAFDELTAELTINESYFFRDEGQFALLRRQVFPELRQRSAPVRVWSAGCASGEEAYSLAITLQEAGITSAQVIGSDLSRPALTRAQQAEYASWSLRGLDAARLRRYFVRAGRRHVLQERFKRGVSFRYLNLAHDAYPSLATSFCHFDVILCRNVLMYFEPRTVAEVAERLAASLNPGGWLLLGGSDPSVAQTADLQTLVTEHGLAYRRIDADEDYGSRNNARVAVSALSSAAERDAKPFDASPKPRTAQRAPRPTIDDRIRLCANRSGAHAALALADQELAHDPLSPHLHFLRGLLLMDLERTDSAVTAFRRVVYLKPALPLPHFFLGLLLARAGKREAARRAYSTAATLAARAPADQELEFGEGRRAGWLVEAAQAQARRLWQGADS